MAQKFTIGTGGVTNSGFKTTPQTEMDEETYVRQVTALQADAVEYIDGFVAMDRAMAQGFYLGDKFGNEEEGRSQIVMTITRDVVLAIVPEILRIFTSSGKLGEFQPNSPRTVEQAAQATDYCNHIVWHDNPGFLILHNAIKDALTVKTGIIKWRWSEDVDVMEASYEKLTPLQVVTLEQDPCVEILEQEPEIVTPAQVDPATGQEIAPAEVVWDIRIRRKREKQRVVIEAVPPEEFIVHRETRDLDTTPYCGHRSLKTKSDLIAMGYDRDMVEDLTASDDSLYMTNIEAQTRNPAINLFSNDTGPNDASKRVLYIEQFVRIDRDGDGIAELRRCCTVGETLLHDEVADGVHFASLCPDPTPHMFIGQSIADQTMDLQLIISAIVRDVLDSLKQSINPRTWGVEGQVNFDDLLNNEVGGVVRMRQPGMAGEFSTTFVGQQAMPVLAFMDAIKQQRTGISPTTTQGISPDILQSTTKDAVTAVVSGSQARIGMIASIFAEDVKRLMVGIYKMVIRHQDKPRVIRLRDKFVEMDPRFWDAELDCYPNVALGRGTDQERQASLAMIIGKQESIIQLLGPTNPLAPVDKYRNALAEFVQLTGRKDAEKYFGEVTPEQIMEAAKAAAPSKAPDPTMMLAEIEKAKVEEQARKNEAAEKIEVQKMIMTDKRERDQMRINALIALQEIESKYKTTVDKAQVEAIARHQTQLATADINAGAQRHGAAVSALAQIEAAHINADAKPVGNA